MKPSTMIRARIAGRARVGRAAIALCACAALASSVRATRTAPTDDASGARTAASQEKAPARGSSDELERAYADLDQSYRSKKRDVSDDVEARSRAGEKVDDDAIKRVASDFWPRFQALSEKGSGHARLWMALAMQDAFPARERALNQKASIELLGDVASNCADEPWIGELARNLTALYIMLPEEDVDRVVDTLAAKSSRKDAVAEALYRSAAFEKTSKHAGAAARADELAKRLQRDYPDTEFAKKLRGETTRATGLNAGNVAPEFTTTDADGVAFKLSDYRGKVVVLDFWGFW